MKKTVPYLILFVLALLICNALFNHGGISFDIGDEDFDGPVGGIAGMLFAGGGILIAIVVCAVVAVILALVFAGVGILVVLALALAAVVTALAVSPLLLPLMLPIGIIWLLSRRSRRRQEAMKPQAA